MKAQIFTLDLAFAVFVYVLIAFFLISCFFIVSDTSASSYKEFKIQKRLFDASEAMITTSNISMGGLAVYGENTVKHHELNPEKRGKFEKEFDSIKEKLLLEDYEIWIKITKRNGETWLEIGKEIQGIKITRFVLCGDEECVLEIIAK